MNEQLPVGTRVVVIAGRWAGRAGVVVRRCTKAFPDYRRVTLDLTPRERVQKTNEFIATRDLLEVVRRCGCGREHTRPGWCALDFVGYQPGAEGRVLEMRNCLCGSTITIDVPAPREAVPA